MFLLCLVFILDVAIVLSQITILIVAGLRSKREKKISFPYGHKKVKGPIISQTTKPTPFDKSPKKSLLKNLLFKAAPFPQIDPLALLF